MFMWICRLKVDSDLFKLVKKRSSRMAPISNFSNSTTKPVQNASMWRIFFIKLNSQKHKQKIKEKTTQQQTTSRE